MKLYGCLRSRATRPFWALAEAGLPFEHEPVIQAGRAQGPAGTWARLNTASPEFLAVNPQGQIPALEDEGLVLTESLAITLHVGRKAGPDLGARDAGEEAQMLNWALVAATGLEPGGIEILMTLREGGADSPEGRARIEAAVQSLTRATARIEAHLQGRDWLVGDRFTVADICASECLRYAQLHPPALEPYPAVRAWLARCQARPAFQAMMTQREAEPV